MENVLRLLLNLIWDIIWVSLYNLMIINNSNGVNEFNIILQILHYLFLLLFLINFICILLFYKQLIYDDKRDDNSSAGSIKHFCSSFFQTLKENLPSWNDLKQI